MTLGQFADYADDLPLDLHVPRVDRRHRPVRGLQPDAVLLFVEPLQRRDVVLEHGHDDVSVARCVLLLDHDEDSVVAVLEDNVATLKRFYKEKDRIRLQPANGTMSPIYARDVQIQGKVIGVIRKLS